MIVLLLSVALAQEPPKTVYVPEGRSVQAEGPSYVVAEQRMDVLLAKAKSVPQLLDDVKSCEDTATTALMEANETLVLVKTEREEDALKIVGLQTEVVTLEMKLGRAKAQRNTAVAITIGMVSGAIMAWQFRPH